MHEASGPRYQSSTLRTHADLHEASALYARVFGYDSPDLQLNTNLLSALVRNGGSAVGVHTADGSLVGFAYGFAGRDEQGAEFHYSQAAVVDPAHQGAGVGRMLKQAQREVALGWGHGHMRWTFDPSLTRNAHFNLSTLRAEGIGYVADYYARPGTDRVVVDWALERSADPYAGARSATPPVLGSQHWGHPLPAPDAGCGAIWLAAPARACAADDERPDADAVVRRVLHRLLADGRVLVASRLVDETTAVHLAVHRDDGESA